MAKKPIHTPDTIRQLFRYEAETGKLFWNPRDESQFCATEKRSQDWAFRRWNTRFSGKEAFTARNDFGYAVTNIGGRIYRAHRVIWAITHGEWPKGDVDHINGVPDDNRLCNLRSVTHKSNLRNQKRRSTNKSGVNGVGWYKAYEKWRAHITLGGKMKCLGYFDTKDEAIAARMAADIQHGYHGNHGRIS